METFRGLDSEDTFDQVVDGLLNQLKTGEHLKLSLMAEQSQFVRFNRAKVRQTGLIQDGQLHLTLMQNQRISYRDVPFTGNWETDWQQAIAALNELRQEVLQLPEDPYLVLPEGTAVSQDTHTGQLLEPSAVVAAILPEVAGLDFTGIYAGGAIVRAYADSAGQKHWFATDTFSLDYSLFTSDGQAVKGTFAGSEWSQAAYAAKLTDSKVQLQRLAQPPKSIPRGQYRTYLAPAAVAELLAMFSWGGESAKPICSGAAVPLHRCNDKKKRSLLPSISVKTFGGGQCLASMIGERLRRSSCRSFKQAS